MTDADQSPPPGSEHHRDGATAPHGLADRGETHGHDDHGHVEQALGPVDTSAWAVGVVGVAIGLVIAACFALAAG